MSDQNTTPEARSGLSDSNVGLGLPFDASQPEDAQWSKSELKRLKLQNAAPLVFNKIPKI